MRKLCRLTSGLPSDTRNRSNARSPTVPSEHDSSSQTQWHLSHNPWHTYCFLVLDCGVDTRLGVIYRILAHVPWHTEISLIVCTDPH